MSSEAMCPEPQTAPQTAVFEGLAMPLAPSLYNVACWLSHNPSDAEDLVQDTYIKALRGFSTFEPGTNFKAWIFRILRNMYLTSRTGLAAHRTVALDEELGDLEATIDHRTPEVHLLRLNDQATLRAAMEKLSPPLLEVIMLCDVEELKYKEIASVLDVPIGTVMSRIARARTALREILQANTQIRDADYEPTSHSPRPERSRRRRAHAGAA